MYLKFFGFREPPFNVTPDPKFFFDSPLHREAWAAFSYGLKEKKGFIVVSGEVGTGKTTLIRKVLRSLEATHHSVFIFNTRLTFDELLETILRDLNLVDAGAGRVAQLERLNEFLLEKVKIGHVVSIIIDEAQNLSEDTLEGVRLLSNLETDRQKLLQIVLVGQPELDAKLNRPSLRQLKQRISLWCRLNSLSEKETEAYIQHRLQVAQYEGPEIFSRATIRSIWEHTSGIPRLINVVCDNALLTAFATSSKVVSTDIIREVVRDLRIQPESHRVEPVRGDQRYWSQPARPSGGGATDFAGGVAARGSGSPEYREDQRVAPGAAASAGVDAAPILPGRPAHGNEIAVSEIRESKRPQVLPLASVAQRREKRSAVNGGTVVSEFQWSSRPISAKPDSSNRPSRSAHEERDDTILSPQFINKMVAALTEAMGPMARVVIEGQAVEMGESLERFPIARLCDLVQGIKAEILNVSLRGAFEEQIAKEIGRHSTSSGWRPSSR